MLKDFLEGILNYFKVFRIATQFNLWKYLFWSGFLSVFAGAGIFYLAYLLGDNLGEGIFSWYKWEIGSRIISAIDNWVGGILILIFALLIFKYVVLIVSAPFMSFASEQLERQLSSYPAHSSFTIRQLIKDFNRGLVLNVRNLIRELFIIAGLLILSLFPPIAIIIPLVIFLVQAFYAGFGNLDYFLERHRNVKGSVQFARKHKLLAVGNGTGFLLLLMIPGLGWFIAPFFGTIAGTLAAVDRIHKK